MVKPTFEKSKTLRVKRFQISPKVRWSHYSSRAAFAVHSKDVDEKNNQLAGAMEWCRENHKRGWSAIKTGLFPLLRDARAINNRLDGKVMHQKEREYCQVLTDKEEKTLVRYVKNKNRACQGIGRRDIKKYVMDVLTIRQALFRAFRGRKGVPLSKNTEKVF